MLRMLIINRFFFSIIAIQFLFWNLDYRNENLRMTGCECDDSENKLYFPYANYIFFLLILG